MILSAYRYTERKPAMCQHVWRSSYSFWHLDFLLHAKTKPETKRQNEACSLKANPAMGSKIILV